MACTCKIAEGSSFWSHLSVNQIVCFKKELREDLDDTEDFQLSTDQSKHRFARVSGKDIEDTIQNKKSTAWAMTVFVLDVAFENISKNWNWTT